MSRAKPYKDEVNLSQMEAGKQWNSCEKMTRLKTAIERVQERAGDLWDSFPGGEMEKNINPAKVRERERERETSRASSFLIRGDTEGGRETVRFGGINRRSRNVTAELDKAQNQQKTG